MNIGQAAKQSGISAKMIRYYEEIGLLHAVNRSDAGYRIYTAQDLKALHFIKHARELGFSSEQMKDLLSLWKNTDRQSAEVKKLALQHIEQLNQKIKSLKDMVLVLEQATECCAGDHGSDCSILNQIEQGLVG